MGYLADYIHFTSGTECPEPYRIWSALSLLGSILGRKIWTMHGRFQILPSLYVCLVGDAGSGKSTAKNDAKKIFTSNFPDYLVSASFQSHQDVIDQMCNVQPRIWEEHNEKKELIKIHSYVPFYFVCNELSSVLSTDKRGMVDFLVDIYDENEFSTGYKNQRTQNPEKKQKLENPYVSVLACAVPKWFMGNLKLDLFDGGLGRRLIIVYCQKNVVEPNPTITKEQIVSKEKVINHLLIAEKEQGELVRTPAAQRFWNAWYIATKKKIVDDPIIAQFNQTKPVQVLKVASLLAMDSMPFKFQLEEEHLQAAVQLIEGLMMDVVKLTSGIGRNELAGVGAQLLDFLDRAGGAASEVHTRKFFRRYLATSEFKEVLQSYIDTQELYIVNCEWEQDNVKLDRNVYMLPGYYEKFMADRNARSSPSVIQPALFSSRETKAHPNGPGSVSYLAASVAQSSSSTPQKPALPGTSVPPEKTKP